MPKLHLSQERVQLHALQAAYGISEIKLAQPSSIIMRDDQNHAASSHIMMHNGQAVLVLVMLPSATAKAHYCFDGTPDSCRASYHCRT